MHCLLTGQTGFGPKGHLVHVDRFSFNRERGGRHKRTSSLLASLSPVIHLEETMRSSAGKRGGVVLCIALVVMLLCEEGQAAYLPSPAPTPPPANSSAVNSSAVPPPAQPTTFPMYGVTPGSLQPQECAGRCAYRCSATAYRKPCMFFCQKCCASCLCVPPGTYGNKQSCPCYNDWKTKRGGPKCP